MATVRLQRVASQIKHVIGHVVAEEIKDPRAGFITIVGIEVAADLKTASVRFSVLGSSAQKRTAGRALESARGYIQARVAQETGLKYTPILSFLLDESAERDIALQQKIAETIKADRRAAVAHAIRARVAAGSIPEEILAAASEIAASAPFVEATAAFLSAILAIDTTPRPDAAAVAAAERACLQLVADELLRSCGPNLTAEFIPIDPDIEIDPAYTLPQPSAGPAEEIYAGRANLVAILRCDDAAARPAADDPLPPLRLALNTHIDTIPPYIAPSRDGDSVRGRGACDAKGQAAMIVAAFRLVRQLCNRFGLRLRSDVCAQFVIDEETGGNGSLSLALQDPFRFDGIVVCEPTALRVRVANRGALWYRAEMTDPGGRLAELAAYVILALEAEGQAIKAESSHPLFPDRPVQTNHGVLGAFGTAPSSVCDLVEIDLTASGLSEAAARQAVARAVGQYIALHGDKLGEHIALVSRGGGAFLLRVHGIAGHMGALDERDSAITKAAFIIRELASLRAAHADLVIELRGREGNTLVIEGAQGFLPTHTMAQVADRLCAAAARGLAEFRATAGAAGHAARAEVSFVRLHNEAFARPGDSALAVYAVESCRRVGIDASAPPAGWNASCDARLFARLFPDRDVIVFGAGRLSDAHGPNESISLREATQGAVALALLILECGQFTV